MGRRLGSLRVLNSYWVNQVRPPFHGPLSRSLDFCGCDLLAFDGVSVVVFCFVVVASFIRWVALALGTHRGDVLVLVLWTELDQ